MPSSGGGAWSRSRSDSRPRCSGRLRRGAVGHEAAARVFIDENIGIIVAGVGLTILFKAYGKTLLAAVTLRRALPLPQPRAIQEPAVSRHRLGAARDRRAEPRQAWRPHPPDAVGGVARARRHAGRRGIPPLHRLRLGIAAVAGLFLFTPSLPQSFVDVLVPLAAAALVLSAALAAYVMVKFFGIVFLGRPREANLAYAKERVLSSARRSSSSRRAASCSACFRST